MFRLSTVYYSQLLSTTVFLAAVHNLPPLRTFDTCSADVSLYNTVVCEKLFLPSRIERLIFLRGTQSILPSVDIKES